jgi:hypothetical protein
MVRRTRRFVFFVYALPTLCGLAWVTAGRPELAVLLLAAPAIGAVAARVIRVAPAQQWTAPRRTWKRSTLRRLQFRLRSLMLLLTGVAILCSLLRGSWTGAIVVACGCAVLLGVVLDHAWRVDDPSEYAQPDKMEGEPGDRFDGM